MTRRIGAPPPPGTKPRTRDLPAGPAARHRETAPLERELAGTRQLVVVMGEDVDRCITRSVCGLVDRDLDVCAGVIIQGAHLHAVQRELHRLCLTTGPTRAQEPLRHGHAPRSDHHAAASLAGG